MYEAIFDAVDGAAGYDEVLRIARVEPQEGAGFGAVDGRAWSCIGNAPLRPSGTRITYSSGARGPTPNVPEAVVDTISIQFNPQLIDENEQASRYYLTAPAAYFLQALSRAYQRRPDLAVRTQLKLSLRRVLEENSPENTGPDASDLFSAVDPYIVIPTYVGGDNQAFTVTVDIFSKDPTLAENYAGGG